MAKGKSTWRYNKLLTARRNYFANAGTLERIATPTSVVDPPKLPTSLPALSQGVVPSGGGGFDFSSILGGDPMTTVLGSTIGAIGGVVGNAISGDLNSGAGNAISGLGDAVGGVPILGGFAKGALNVIGGGVNALLGSKLNEANIQAAKSDIARLNNARADAANFDALGQKIATTAGRTMHGKSFYGKDGVFSNKAGSVAADLEEQARVAGLRQDLALLGNVENLTSDQLAGLEANYMASGGSIHIKPENRGKFTATKKRTGKTTEELTHSKNPLTRKRAIFAQNARKWKHAFGGELMTHGADFSNGMVTIGNGGSHEENPFEGVPMGVDNEGVPNLVEEGETIFNDYVFSKRLNVPKAIREKYKLRGTKEMSFAEASKQLAKESEERPNDPISIRGLQALMSDLANAQEEVKGNEQSNKYANGGMVNKFDGKSQPSQKLNTYKNYVQLGKDTDFYTPEYLQFWDYMNDPKNEAEATKWLNRINSGEFGPVGGNTFTLADIQRLSRDYKKGPVHNAYYKASQEYNTNALKDRLLSNVPKVEEDIYIPEPEVQTTPISHTVGKGPSPDTSKDKLSFSKLPTWMRYAPAAGFGIGVLTDTLGLTNKPDYGNADAILEATRGSGTYQPVSFNPIGNYLGYTPFDREFYINQMNAQSGATRRALLQNAGMNRGAGMAALLASDYNTQGQLGQLARQAEEYNLAQRQRVEEFNRATNMANSEGFLKADIANQGAQAKLRDFNLRGTMAAAQMREAARMAADQARSANLSGLFQSLGDIGAENEQRNWRNAMYLAGVFGGKMNPQSAYLMGLGPKPKARGGKIKRRKKGLTI